MVTLQDDLNLKVNRSIQDSLNQFQAADIAGKIDTPQELEALRVNLLQNLDKQIAGITDANINQRQFIIERYDNIAKEKQKYFENSQAINSDMSQARGYFVNGNGDPVISATTGQRIPMAIKPPMPPVFDAKSGNLISFKT